MIRMELTEKEATLLAEMLQSYLSDLRTELMRTENREWRAEMKDRENFGKDILRRLSENDPSARPLW